MNRIKIAKLIQEYIDGHLVQQYTLLEGERKAGEYRC